MKKKDVALVLSGGGARGAAHIGVIRELERRGYRIVSVTGTSIGSLVGFAYASGRLDELEKVLLSLGYDEMARLLDFTFSGRGLVKGKRIFALLRKTIPDRNLEELPIPTVMVASDLTSGEERVYTRGSAYQAMRSSMAIPGVLTAVNELQHTLVDGGILNPLPLNRAVRPAGSILVAVNLYAVIDSRSGPLRGVPVRKVLESSSLMDRMRDTWKGIKAWRGDVMDYLLVSSETTASYAGLLKRAAALMMLRMAEQSIRLEQPDIVVSIPFTAAGPLDFQKTAQLLSLGTDRSVAALDAYEAEGPREKWIRWCKKQRRRFS